MEDRLDVEVVVRELGPIDARVAAGADGLWRSVTRAIVAESPEQLHRAGDGDLVVTSGAVLAGADEGDDVAARLDAAGAAALAVRVDGTGDLPAALLAAADRLSLPVVALSAETRLTEVVAVVGEALLAAQRHRLEWMHEVHRRFTRIVLAGGGTAEIASELHDLLGCPVGVLDAVDEPVAVAPADGPDAAAVAGAPDERAVRVPIRAGDQHYGSIVALRPPGSVSDDEEVALEHAAMAVALRHAQATASAEAEERFAAITLEELISGHGSTGDIAERAASFGWDLTRPRAVLLASVDPPTPPEALLASALATIGAAARAALGHDAIVWRRSATIAALVAPATDAAAERREIAEALRRELDERLKTVTVSIGVGRRVAEPADLATSFIEASRAVDVGRWVKRRHVTELFDELGLERLLASTPQAELADFVRDTIGPLRQHDALHGTELVDTLAVWLETRNMAEAARRLHVHYNTLKNRLQRIESILGPVLSDAGRALECAVAIHVARHYDVPWSDGPEPSS